MIVYNERDRYLENCVDHLLEFCDKVVVLDDGSNDGTSDALGNRARVELTQSFVNSFYRHEGNARNTLIDETLADGPTHVLTIDADEFISDGPALRKMLEADPHQGVWTLCMQEIWRADDYLWTREDGGWCSHDIAAIWRPDALSSSRMANRQLACGRLPMEADHWVAHRRSKYAEQSYLHFGWTCEADRAARYQRYVEHDGGQFHASAHLQSIMWPDSQVKLERMDWPAGLESYRQKLTERANRAS